MSCMRLSLRQQLLPASWVTVHTCLGGRTDVVMLASHYLNARNELCNLLVAARMIPAQCVTLGNSVREAHAHKLKGCELARYYECRGAPHQW